MALSRRTFELILDLIENKMSCMEGWDQATNRERTKLEECRRELEAVFRGPSAKRGRGRPAKASEARQSGEFEQEWSELAETTEALPDADQTSLGHRSGRA